MQFRFAKWSHRIFQGLTVALVAAFVLASAPSGAGAQTLQVVNVGTLPLEGNGTIYYAKQLGFFKDAGLDVHITPMNSGPVIAAAVLSGALDIGLANVATLAQAHVHGLPLLLIAPGAAANPSTMTDVILVAKDSPFRSGADLNGKTIAINGLKDLQQITASAWVDKHGGDSKTVKFLEVPIPEMAVAVESHRVDAALDVEPFVTATKADTRILGDVLDGIAPRFMVVGWFATDAWTKAHPDLAVRFSAAIIKAAQWANMHDHDKESLSIIVQNTKVDPQVAASMARTRFGVTLESSMVQPVLDAALKYGVLDHPVAANDLIWRAP